MLSLPLPRQVQGVPHAVIIFGDLESAGEAPGARRSAWDRLLSSIDHGGSFTIGHNLVQALPRVCVIGGFSLWGNSLPIGGIMAEGKTPKMEVPPELRAMTERGVEQAKAAFDSSM